MIPTTVGSFVAFLGLIAPGLIFQLSRESARPSYQETTFRELSRVALTSLIFTVAAVALLLALRLAWPQSLIDPRAWLVYGQGYLKRHLAVVCFTFGLEVLVACLLALVSARFMSRERRGNMSPFGVWYHVLRRDRPAGTRPWLTLRLADGTEFAGLLRHYTESKVLDDQEIAIGGPQLTMTTAGGVVSEIGRESDAVVVRGAHVVYMIVRYQDRDGKLVRRVTKKSPQGKRDAQTADRA
jgi:Family of unknown function (DUF6338)